MNYIVDDIGTVVSAMRPFGGKADQPYYMYGHRVEIANRLLLKGSDAVLKYQKYPLVAMKLDTPEKVSDGLWHFSLNIAILTYTNLNYDSTQRYTNVFKPILYPLYDLFLTKLRNSGLFMWPGDQKYPEHTKIDRLYWGTEGKTGNEANIFSDPLDAIELIDLKLSKRIKNC